MKYQKEYNKRMRMAKKIILSSKNTSISHLQRKMNICYNYADMIMEDISKLSGFRFLNLARNKRFRYRLTKKLKKQK